MEKITYGAPGLVDWVAQIRAGGATVRVHFSGGALTSYGVTPAEYTTTNPFIQKVIENSAYFKEGRILRLRSMTIADPQKHKHKKSKSQAAPAPAPAPQAAVETKSEETPTPALDVAEPGQDTTAAEEAPAADYTALTKVEVTCLQDAQAYLQENFNISSYKVRSYEAAQRAAGEHGVYFAGAKFDAPGGLNQDESEEQAD